MRRSASGAHGVAARVAELTLASVHATPRSITDTANTNRLIIMLFKLLVATLACASASKLGASKVQPRAIKPQVSRAKHSCPARPHL